MATKTKSNISLTDFLDEAEEYALLAKQGKYIGPCVVQCPGAWTRCGPTWLSVYNGVGVWLVIGPGVYRWGTEEGLAQLATKQANPTWHGSGMSIAPLPNVIFAIRSSVLKMPHMENVLQLANEAKKWTKSNEKKSN